MCRLDVPVDPANPIRHCGTVVNPGACGPAGSTCGATTDCCNGLFCAPSSGICTEPPPIVLYASTNYVRSPDFDGGTCPAGTRVVWRFFQWQTQTPSISYIEFFAQTADDTTTFSSVPVAPTTVTTAGVFPVGVAAGAATTTWTAAADGKTIDDRLRALGAVSKRYLRVTARFAPSNDLVYAPSLSDWRTTFSCVPSE